MQRLAAPHRREDARCSSCACSAVWTCVPPTTGIGRRSLRTRSASRCWRISPLPGHSAPIVATHYSDFSGPSSTRITRAQHSGRRSTACAGRSLPTRLSRLVTKPSASPTASSGATCAHSRARCAPAVWWMPSRCTADIYSRASISRTRPSSSGGSKASDASCGLLPRARRGLRQIKQSAPGTSPTACRGRDAPSTSRLTTSWERDG